MLLACEPEMIKQILEIVRDASSVQADRGWNIINNYPSHDTEIHAGDTGAVDLRKTYWINMGEKPLSFPAKAPTEVHSMRWGKTPRMLLHTNK